MRVIPPASWPVVTLYTTRNSLVMRPAYQRQLVWTKAQKQLLIDSVLRKFDIPKFYLRKTSSALDCFEVVDGQQRLSTIFDFLDDKFALAKDCDAVDGHDVAGKKFSQLDVSVKSIIHLYQLTVVVLEEASEDDIRELFLRLQNGTTLKAQEKRNARPGLMREFVCEVAKHKFFDSVMFSNSRCTFDLVAAQMTLFTLTGDICNLKDRDLNRMYETNKDFDKKSQEAKKVIRVLDFLCQMFPDKTPELKKRFNVVSLYILVSKLLDRYVVIGREKEISDWFVDFEHRRDIDDQKDPEEQDPYLVPYHEKTAHSTDAYDSLNFRNTFLMTDLFLHVPHLKAKDSKRLFDEVQRRIIFRRDKGVCKMCGKVCGWDDFQADHIIPWSKGGQTEIENGQVLCPECNASKGAC
jgi:hypothetical protein